MKRQVKKMSVLMSVVTMLVGFVACNVTNAATDPKHTAPKETHVSPVANQVPDVISTPEPAAIGLVVVIGGALLLRRRHAH